MIAYPQACGALLVTGALAGCSSAAMANLGVTAPPGVEADPNAEHYVLGPSQASIEADVSAGASYTLRFARQKGTLVVSPRRPEATSVDVIVDTNSAESSLGVVADIAKDQFLHTAQFPVARFTSSSLRKRPDGEYDLYGDLELCGTKKSLVVQATIAVDPCRIAVNSEFSIDRRIFGAVSDGSLDGIVSDTVVVRIQADVKRSSAPATCAAEDEDG
ncbi:MAG TPA: YceI family protein [Polyangiaceae bacterium]|nr:YceI family protein [Polyangiaceae bacterium]